MKNIKLDGTMTKEELILALADNNPITLEILKDVIERPNWKIILLTLYLLDITGIKIYKIYRDCANMDLDKFYRTIDILRLGVYTKEEIKANLNLFYSVPFIDDGIKVKGIPEYNEPLNTGFENWEAYTQPNRVMALTKIKEESKRMRGR